MDARAALATIATRKLAFTEPGSIFLDGKNVLSIVVEIDTALLPGWTLVGVVAETLTSGEFNVRIERVGRPEVKNMMLAPKDFDPVNRDLEIRDLYNMEDAFHLGESYAGAFRARLDANLAFWDGLDGKQDWPVGEDGSHPLTDLVLADYLVVDVTKPYVEQGSFLEIELAARRGEPHRTCGGRTLNDDVMDTIFTLLVNAGDGPTIRDGVDAATRPGTLGFPYLADAEPEPARTSRAPLTMERVMSVDASDVALELDDIQAGALFERPRRTSAPTCCSASATGTTAASWCGGCTGSSTPPRPPATADETSLTVAFTYQGLKALGVPQASLDSFAPEFRRGDGGPRRDPGGHRRERPRALGGAARHARRPRRHRRPLLRRGPAATRSRRRPARPMPSSRASS